MASGTTYSVRLVSTATGADGGTASATFTGNVLAVLDNQDASKITKLGPWQAIAFPGSLGSGTGYLERGVPNSDTDNLYRFAGTFTGFAITIVR